MKISKRKMILPSCSTNTRYRFQKHFWNRTENRFFFVFTNRIRNRTGGSDSGSGSFLEPLDSTTLGSVFQSYKYHTQVELKILQILCLDISLKVVGTMSRLGRKSYKCDAQIWLRKLLKQLCQVSTNQLSTNKVRANQVITNQVIK